MKIDKQKDEYAKNSFFGVFLNDGEKILICKWIHPHKINKFNLLNTT